MSTAVEHPFQPDYAVAPGVTLRNLLDEIDVSQADLSTRSGLSAKHVNRIVQGIVRSAHETALITAHVAWGSRRRRCT